MNKAPRLVYLLRKSKQTEEQSIPVMHKNDFPLRFYFKGHEVCIDITTKGNIEVTKSRLTGAEGK